MWWSTLAGKLERATALDPVVDAVGGVAGALLPRGPLKDALHGRWLGHPLHPMLVALPLGLWTATNLLDLTAGERGRPAARRLVGVGVVTVVPTAAAGLADWSALGSFDRPKRVGVVHAAANAMTTAVFAASWLARHKGNHRRGRHLALMGSAGLALGGYLGGHLAYSNGVGMNRNADLPKEPIDWTAVDEEQVVLSDDGSSAISARCSHFGGPLREGERRGGCVVCPWHQSEFRLGDGSVARGPATAPQLSYEARRAGGRLEVRPRR